MQNFTDIVIDKQITESDLKTIENKYCLVLTNLEQIPPHCSVLCNHKWFSLNYNECRINTDADVLFKSISLKNKSAIFIELKTLFDVSLIEQKFSAYQKINFQDQITCISPVKEILISQNIPLSQNMLLYEMIETLYKNQQIKHVFGFKYTNEHYRLFHYSVNDLKTMKI